jgi:hypothetical protein
MNDWMYLTFRGEMARCASFCRSRGAVRWLLQVPRSAAHAARNGPGGLFMRRYSLYSITLWTRRRPVRLAAAGTLLTAGCTAHYTPLVLPVHRLIARQSNRFVDVLIHQVTEAFPWCWLH